MLSKPQPHPGGVAPGLKGGLIRGKLPRPLATVNNQERNGKKLTISQEQSQLPLLEEFHKHLELSNLNKSIAISSPQYCIDMCTTSKKQDEILSKLNRSLLNGSVFLYTIPPDAPCRNRLQICIRVFFGLCYNLFLPSAPIFSALP